MTKTEEYLSKNPSYKILGSKRCLYCNLEFNIYTKTHLITKKFCSLSCITKYRFKYNPPISLKREYNCSICNKIFKKVPSTVKTKTPCCSPICQAKLYSKNSIQRFTGKRKTPLRKLIRRNYLTEKWINSIFKRDDYKCVQCGSQDKLNAHHIKPFKILLNEFIEQNKLNPECDKDKLLQLALKYEPFWDLNNGKTLCIYCHQKEHPNLTLIPSAYLKR